MFLWIPTFIGNVQVLKGGNGSKARLVGSGRENLSFYFAVIVVPHSKMNLCASLCSCESC